MSSLGLHEILLLSLVLIAKVAFWGALAFGAYKLYQKFNKAA